MRQGSWIVAGTRSTTTRAPAMVLEGLAKSPPPRYEGKIVLHPDGSRQAEVRFSSSTADCGAPSGKSILAGRPGRLSISRRPGFETPTA